MSDQLELQLREFDLPRFWDGLAVVWDGWEPPHTGLMFICPPTSAGRSCCPACGSQAQASRNHGRVARVPAVTHEAIAADDANRERLPLMLRGKRRSKALVRLFAFRCPDCRHDVVHDVDTDQVWDLDLSDYGPEGSRS